MKSVFAVLSLAFFAQAAFAQSSSSKMSCANPDGTFLLTDQHSWIFGGESRDETRASWKGQSFSVAKFTTDQAARKVIWEEPLPPLNWHILSVEKIHVEGEGHVWDGFVFCELRTVAGI